MRKILDVILEEENHIYRDSNNNRYDSITTILGNYKEKFDPYKIMDNGGTLVGNYALKNGGTEQEWIDAWSQNKDRACIKGTAFHKIKEDLTNNADFFKHNLKDFPVQSFWSQTDRNPGIDYSQLADGAYTELTLFNRRHMIAGQADRVMKEGDFVDIDDYKTNGRFDTLSFKPPRGSYKMMQYPVNNIMDCHLGHYTLQLSCYGWMLEQFGLKVRNLRVLHYQILDEDEKKILNGEPVEHIQPSVYLLEYKKAEAEKMIMNFVHNRKKRR